jgi:hypothetical protein
MMFYFLRFSIVIPLLLLLTSCQSSTFPQLIESADQLATQAGLVRSDIEAGPFELVSFARLAQSEAVASIYIEGDGRAWINRRVSLNPTPKNPMALKLAAADKRSASIIYLARPCQFVATFSDPDCDAKFWTLERYSADVVASYNAALDYIKQQHHVSQFKVFGYSGGGALAVLIAATRKDVVAITTIGANLDIDAFTNLHKVTPLRGSLNPTDYSSAVKNIPQTHFFGKEDEVVPISSVARYRNVLRDQRCANFIELADVNHHSGWLNHWPSLLEELNSCEM